MTAVLTGPASAARAVAVVVSGDAADRTDRAHRIKDAVTALKSSGLLAATVPARPGASRQSGAPAVTDRGRPADPRHRRRFPRADPAVALHLTPPASDSPVPARSPVRTPP